MRPKPAGRALVNSGTAMAAKWPLNCRSVRMLIRMLCGFAGFSVVLLALTWPQLFSAPSDSLVNAGAGFLTAAVIMSGVYLMFYSLTGDWLPKLRKHKDS